MTKKRRTSVRPQPRWNRPSRLSEVHGLGGNGHAVRDARRSTEIVRAESAAATRTAGRRSGRTQLRADQRQPHGLQQAGESGRCGHAASSSGQDQCSTIAPEFLLHTGDISHLSKPDEFDAVDQILKSTGKETFFVPGEHDVLEDDGKQFLERYGKESQGPGWYSFDKKGVHFVGLVNVMNLKAGGLGNARARSARMAGRRCEASEVQHADRGLCAHSAVDGVSGMGMGYGRQRAGAWIL